MKIDFCLGIKFHEIDQYSNILLLWLRHEFLIALIVLITFQYHFFFRINFKKIIPKSNMFKSSEVLTYMNDEAINTDEGGEMQSDSSFMQKYTRSNMMTTEELEKIDELTSGGIGDEGSYGSLEEPDDLPALCKCEMKEQSNHIEQISTKVDFKSSTVDEKLYCQPAIEPAIAISEPKKMYSESQEELKQQVSNIQDQIRKLSSLPSIIQTAINDIAAQISGLIPVIQEGHILAVDNHDSIPCDNTENQKGEFQELPLASQNDKTITESESQSHTLAVDNHDSIPCEHTKNQKSEFQELQLTSQCDKTITESESQVLNGKARKESVDSQIIVESNHQEQARIKI